ncbi:DUF3786 domain-containing protein [Desulfosarcina ovata]|uniref:DUF3786 domain-containing protein n=1 Tax=Desulfosarcina ovata subsp. ovata TaxID=2752305 RepID=A0A5K8AGT8_9BACT|nr:DUF3786 domain-containing protein [Desulfosarcina ovata]BBO91070.1 hypothetical protein DSCOOX_42500 [Desulfosarcina ovata subsp. ovata]
MTRNAPVSVYETTYHHYLEQLQARPFAGKADVLGLVETPDGVGVSYFGRPVRLTSAGLIDETGARPDFPDCVVICRYLLMAPAFEPSQTRWVAYRDFPDTGPLTVFWSDTVEGTLVRTYTGRVADLARACADLGASTPEMSINCDLCRRFAPLPKVPLLLIFNDADDDFPASASLLFEKRASTYLDAESQAILGHQLCRRLIAAL